MNNGIATYGWATEECLRHDGTSPAALLETLMSRSECAPFGPIHHVLTGFSLLTCVRNAQGPDARAQLAGDLSELELRARFIPGGACARWGICGAAVSAGMAFAIINGSVPLEQNGWSQGQLIVAKISEAIAKSGQARCCKRDSRLAVRIAARELSSAFDVKLTGYAQEEPCAVAEKNTVCSKERCPFHDA